jgi:hypothetical protein
MAVEKGKAKNVYIVITHTRQAKDKDGKQNIVEKCEFVDQIKPRHETSATVILDFLKEEVLKNRDGGEAKYNDFSYYLFKNYPKQMQELTLEYKS